MEDVKLKNLILENQNLIYSIIHKFRSKDLEDLFQVGCIGLIKAYHKFDSSLNVKFTSYAYNFIVGEIYQYIINNRNIRLSPTNIKLINSIKKAEDYLINYLGRNPTIDEICSFIEIPQYKYEEIQNTKVELDIDNLYNIVNESHLTKDEMIDLRNALKDLTKDEKEIIKARYYDNYTQSELAKYYHTNQVKISREEKKILTKLRRSMSIN